MVFRVTDATRGPRTTSNPSEWRFSERRAGDKYAREGVNKLLVGNKSDAGEGRQVETAQGKEFAETRDIPFLETSAKLGTFVDTAFLMMAHDIKTKMTTGGTRQTGLKSGGGDDKKGCC